MEAREEGKKDRGIGGGRAVQSVGNLTTPPESESVWRRAVR